MRPNPHFFVDLVAFTEEILKGKLHILCSVACNSITIFSFKTPNGGNSLIWRRSGNHSMQWKIARVNIRPRSGRQIVFEGVRGLGFSGDIAIDDVKMTKGYCGTAGLEIYFLVFLFFKKDTLGRASEFSLAESNLFDPFHANVPFLHPQKRQ